MKDYIDKINALKGLENIIRMKIDYLIDEEKSINIDDIVNDKIKVKEVEEKLKIAICDWKHEYADSLIPIYEGELLSIYADNIKLLSYAQNVQKYDKDLPIIEALRQGFYDYLIEELDMLIKSEVKRLIDDYLLTIRENTKRCREWEKEEEK